MNPKATRNIVPKTIKATIPLPRVGSSLSLFGIGLPFLMSFCSILLPSVLFSELFISIVLLVILATKVSEKVEIPKRFRFLFICSFLFCTFAIEFRRYHTGKRYEEVVSNYLFPYLLARCISAKFA